MEQKKGTWKVITGFVVLILTVSVMSGAISATDNVSTTVLYGVEDAGLTAETVAAGEFQAAKPPNSALFQSPPLGSYSHDSDLLKITVGEQTSSGWHFQYDPVNDPGNFIRSVYGEHYAVASNNWGGVIQSSYFTIDTYFGSVEAPDTAMLHYGNLSLTRQVNPPEGSDKSFSITFVLSNTGNSTLENVRFFQGIDYDIYDSGYDYAWYSATSDTVWQNDDRYFKNGFSGSRTSSHHDCNYYGSMWSDMSNGVLNDLDKHPASGTADCGIALQWDAGNLTPGASWDLTITFYFGEAAGIEANAGPDQTVYRSEHVTFDASRSSSVGNITTYEWDLNNDSVYEVSVSTPVYVYSSGFDELGEHIVNLRITDDAGRNDTDSVRITVIPNVDLLVHSLTFTPTEFIDGETVSLTASIMNNGTDNATDFYVRFEVDGSYLGRKRIAQLPAGDNTTVTQLWNARAGAHNVTVRADEYDELPESNETNNERTNDLPATPYPDLTIIGLSWTPTEPVSGELLTLTATVANNGSGSTVRNFYVRFEVDGSYIGHQVVSGLGAGNTTTVAQAWTAVWADTVNVTVDEYDAVAESNESNNKVSTALPGLPFPDLIVTNLSWTAPETVDAGDLITIAATIENTGGEFSSTMSRPLKVAFRVNGEQVGSRDIVGGIRAGQPLFTSFTWIAQPVTNPAVCVIADYSQIIPESNESNNQLCKPMSVVIASPDLTITQVTFNRTGTIHVGEIVQITAELKNIGIGNYSGNFDVGFFVNGTFIGVSGIAGGLPAGTSNLSTFNWIASSGSNPVVNARVDFFDIVQESNETNNEKTAIAPLSIPYADLEITNIAWTPAVNITDRDPVVFNVTVKNAGAEEVITDFTVYFEIDRYFTRSNVISGGLAAGASTTTSFIWTATPGAGHNATVKADQENSIPELNKTNNNRVQLLPFNVSFVEIFEVKIEPAVVTTGVGGETHCSVRIYNYGSAAGTFNISVGGLNATWCTFNPPAVHLLAGQQAVVDLRIAVPSACEASGIYPFQVSVTSQTTNLTKNVSASLMVESTPVLHELLPANKTAFGSTDVTFSWSTYTNASTTLYLKAEGDPAYATYTGAAGLRHNVTVMDLARNTNYSYYARSTSACGANQSAVRTFYIGNGISFTQNVYEFTVERDYNQLVTIAVQNTDDEYHELLLEVPITFEDLVLGFVGDGSQDNVIPLNPGESKAVTLAVQCSDAMYADYEFTATLTSSTGTETLTDNAQVKIHVHVPAIDYELEELIVDNVTLMKTLRLTNTGDPITDLSISVADNFTANAYIEPVIEHYRLAAGESLEFHVIPLLSSPDFQPHSAIPPVFGDIVVQGGGVQAKEHINFTVPEGKRPYKAVVSSPGIINIGRVKTHHCNNKPNTKTPFDVHSGVKDKVRDDPLIIKFSAPGWEVRPHDLYISINGYEVGALINTIPEGYYKFEVDPAFLIYPEHGVAKNYIELHSVHQNGGHYLVSSDVEVRLNLINYETWVIASSQEEANQIAEANLPPGFYESPDNITIGSVELTPEASSAVPLGLSAGYPEVQIGRKTTIQCTAEPNLDVDATFSNGDGSVHLAEVSPGVYQGTWTPRNPGEPSTGQCVITIRAKGSGGQGEKTQTVKISEPESLEVKIIEPSDGSTVSAGDAVIISAHVEGDYQAPPVATGAYNLRSDSGGSGSSQVTVIASFSNGDPDLILSGGYNNVYGGIWTPKNPGDCTIKVKAVDSGGRSGSDTVSVKVEEELKLTIKRPEKNFEVLEYGHFQGGYYQKIRVQLTGEGGRGVKDAQVSAEITPPNEDLTFYPGEVDGEYVADWYPKREDVEVYTCTIKVTAEKNSGISKSKVTESVTGKVDPIMKITDVKPEGVYHKSGSKYLRFSGLRDNTYDPLWDDKKPDPLDDDYVGFSYRLNKDVDEVIITEYKDVLGSNEVIKRYIYKKGQEQTKRGLQMYYMNVKDLDKDQYFIEVNASKMYETPEMQPYKERENEDCAWDRLHIEREIFGRIHIEATGNVKTGSATVAQLQDAEWWRRFGRGCAWATLSVAVGIVTAGWGIWWGIGGGVLTSHGGWLFETFIGDAETMGFVDDSDYVDPKLQTHLSIQDRALGVRFTTKAFEWEENKYSEGLDIGGPGNLLWLDDAEFIYVDMYRRWWDNANYNGDSHDIFAGKSPRDMIGCIKEKGQVIKNPPIDVRDGMFSIWFDRFTPLNDFNLPTLFSGNSAFRPPDLAPGKLNPGPAAAARDQLNIYYEGIYIKSKPWLLGLGSSGWRELVQGVPRTFVSKGSSSTTGMYAPQFDIMFSRTSNSDAVITGSYLDYGTDTDGNGLYDYLTIGVGVDVAELGDYMVQGILEDNDGTLLVWADNHTHLTPGSQMILLNFSGKSIYQNGENKSYKLTHVIFVDKSRYLVSHEFDFISGLYNTSLYNYTKFERPTINFTDEYSDNGADMDGDGLYDYLTVEVGMNVEDAGDYYIFGWLSNDSVLTIVEAENASHLDASVQNIQLDFDGYAIRQQDVGGPYSLNVEVRDEQGNIMGHRYGTFQISDYSVSDFQRPPGQFSGDYSDRGTDTDSDGLYDYLTIDAEVIIDKAGNYTLFGQLEDINGTFLVSATEYLVLEAGTQTVQLNFNGVTIHQHGLDGVFKLRVFLSDVNGRAATGEHITAMYSSGDFDGAPSAFDGSFSDYGNDTNGDGYFDILTVDVGMDVVTPGDYGLDGLLYDQTGVYVGSASTYLHLENGSQTGQLVFDGQTIREHGLNGSYNLSSLSLSDESGRQIDYSEMAYTTSTYNSTDFQPPLVLFTDSYSDYGTDTDGDGKYNYLILELSVTVSTPGYYTIIGTLTDRSGNFTLWTSNYSYLAMGLSTVQLSFDGLSIRQYGVDGPYNLSYLEIYNENVSEIDRRTDIYITAFYNYTEFETTLAYLNDSYSDYGVDLNGNGLFDLLSVEIGVTVLEAGNYSLEGRLADNTGKFFGFDYNYSIGLEAGNYTIQLDFDGRAIRLHGLNGPYHVKNLELYGEGGIPIDYETDAHTTSAYVFSQFEGYPIDLSLLESDIIFDPESPAVGESVNITAIIRNTGTSDVNQVVVQFFNGDPDAGGTQIGSDQTISVIPRESTGTAQVTWTALLGTHDIFVRVDPYNSTVEASETNNQANKRLTVSGVPLPDLTLGPEDILFIPPPAGSTGSSPGYEFPAVIESRDVRLSAPSPVERLDSSVGAAPATTVAIFIPSFTIVNLTYPPTVNPDQTFQVTVNTNYSFETTTEVYVGIWDYDSWMYIADTPDGTTLSGTGEASYTFNLTAPSSGMMELAADLWYLDGVDWWFVDFRDFTVNVSEAQPDFTLNATPSAQTVIPGASADYLIALTAWNGFNAPVTLSLSGLPSGATGVFEPHPVIPSSQTNLTISTTGATPPGNYTLNISGVGGSITHQTTVMLNIIPAEEVATLSATIHNRGTLGATSVTVQFFDGDPAANGTQIGNDQMIAAIPAGGTGHAEVSWDVSEAIGTHTIYVRVDPVGSIEESNEGNNQAFRDVGVPGVTCSDPAVSINGVETSVTDDPLGDGYNVAHAPANVDLSSAKGFMITATGPNGTYVFNITFLSPVSENFKLFKLPHWHELPYNVLDAYTIQVQLSITDGELDPAFILAPVAMFDTGAPANPYPSISGTFNGTIIPFENLSVAQLYTYSCAGTGGYGAYVAFSYPNGTKFAEASWIGYTGDWHHLPFQKPFTLQANETYHYTLVTGSYPQLYHQSVLNATGGIIRCTEFVDVNGKRHEGWIPAIRLEG